MVMRGGTSKGAYFLRDDLPSNPDERDEILLRIMGTPDPRQIDGLGGAHPLTSKVAIVGPAASGRADVEYLFVQLGVDKPTASITQNCGNLLAGVGPFAVERGLAEIEASGDAHEASVTVHMMNTDSYAVATFPVLEGSPVYEGDTAISGVPGTAAPVRLDFDNVAGGSTGALLPSGQAVDQIDGVECTLIDNGMPVVVMRADDLGVTGYEDCPELEQNGDLRERLERIRLAAGPLMNLGDVTKNSVPKLTLVAPPKAGGTLSTRTLIPHRCHDAIGVLGGVSVATAAMIDGTPAASVAAPIAGASVVLEHPTGSFEAVIEVRHSGDQIPVIERAGIIRTARKLMDGMVFPRSHPNGSSDTT